MPTLKAWIVVRGKRNNYRKYPPNSPYAGQLVVDACNVVKTTVNKPETNADEVAIQIEFDIDESHFLEATSKITATIPKNTSTADISASVHVPVKGRGKSSAASVINHP